MAEETKVDVGDGNGAGKEGEGFGSPPAAPVAAKEAEDPVGELRRLAEVLARANDRRLMLEYLRLRRAVRA